MDIRNPTQFANFVRTSGLIMKDMSFQQVGFCVDQISKACNCWKAEDKKKLYDNCVMVYMNSVKNVVPRFKNDFLAQTQDRSINFYTENGNLICVVNR